ncbi:MAG: glycosyltransferase family 4 protein, partial [Candidatus Omnitrophica bacterium]|nr:glycosyltransferase family 4 protein [Candidatus Omnitrophota bacterium]
VHDVIFKAFSQGHTPVTIDAGERQFEQIRKHAARIICCSDNTARDLKGYFQIPEERIVRIYPGVDKGIFNRIAREEEATAERVLLDKGVEQPFILSVGTIEPRKNLINSIHAFHALRAKKDFSGKLVVIGMDGWLHEDLVDLIETLGLKGHIIFLGYLSDSELRYFYNKAEVFIFPSFYEGFGFPILEAFCCGAPVVTSNVSSCPEIAGDAALTVDPGNPKDIADAIARIVSDQDLRQALKEKGSKRAREFDFRKTAEETLKVYEEVYGL